MKYLATEMAISKYKLQKFLLKIISFRRMLVITTKALDIDSLDSVGDPPVISTW